MHECKQEVLINRLVEENKEMREEARQIRENLIKTDIQYSYINTSLGELKEKINNIVSQPVKLWGVVISTAISTFVTAVVMGVLVLILK